MTETKKKPKSTREYIEDQVAGLTSNPGCGTTHYNLAIGLIPQGKYDDAEVELVAALDSSPTLGEAYVAHNNLALAFFEKGEFDKAVFHCDLSQKHGFQVEPKFLEQLKSHR